MRITCSCGKALQMVVCLILFWGIGCGSSKDGGKSSTGGPRPDFTMTAAEFEEEIWKGGGELYDKKYLGKGIEITGIVQSFVFGSDNKEDPNQGQLSNNTFLIRGRGTERVPVKCRTKETPWWKQALPGQTVKVRGKCTHSADVDEAEIVEVSGSEPQSLTADQLAQEHNSNPKTFSQKYFGNYVRITGEISKVEFHKGLALVSFKSSGGDQVLDCTFSDPRMNKGLAAGQKITFLATLGRRGLEFTDGVIYPIPTN